MCAFTGEQGGGQRPGGHGHRHRRTGAGLWQCSGRGEGGPRGRGLLCATGYGRTTWRGADHTISKLTAHGLGNHFLFPEARTVIDIGGQDAKAIELDANGQMAGFVMNGKCAAGTGRFLEVMTSVLRIPIGELEVLAAQAERTAPISSTCTVFSKSEVISQLAAASGGRWSRRWVWRLPGYPRPSWLAL